MAIDRRAVIYACGNGGSSAIASHLLCDFNKGIRTDTDLLPRVVALTDNVPMLTAIGNDIGYDEIFSFQLSGLGNSSDLLIAISSSGNSENIVRALSIAKDIGMSTIALTGFDGGRAKKIADVAVHVSSSNYGVVEDIHQSVMHVFAQYLRSAEMSDEAIASRVF